MNTPEVQEALKKALKELAELEELFNEEFREVLVAYFDIHSPEFLRHT